MVAMDSNKKLDKAQTLTRVEIGILFSLESEFIWNSNITFTGNTQAKRDVFALKLYIQERNRCRVITLVWQLNDFLFYFGNASLNSLVLLGYMFHKNYLKLPWQFLYLLFFIIRKCNLNKKQMSIPKYVDEHPLNFHHVCLSQRRIQVFPRL